MIEQLRLCLPGPRLAPWGGEDAWWLLRRVWEALEKASTYLPEWAAIRKEVLPELQRLAQLASPELRQQIEEEASSALAEVKGERRTAPSTAPTVQATPPAWLCSWREILETLGLKNTPEDRQKVQRLNANYDGPITPGKKGGQPFVDKGKLLAWWEALERLHTKREQRFDDKEATVAPTRAYGRRGEVVPDIDGRIKRHRRTTS
jgi:hypothetical protein